MHLVDSATQLRLRQLRSQPFVRDSGALSALVRDGLVRAIDRAHTVRTLHDGTDLHAFVALWHEPDSWYGAPITHIELDALPHAVPWVERTLAELGPLPMDAELHVHAGHARWLPRLGNVGLHPSAVVLVGEPATALAALGAGPGVEAFTDLGLRLEPLGPGWADGAMQLEADWYGAHPEYAWFAANPGPLARTRAEIAGARAGYAVVAGATLVGLLRADVRTTAAWGRCAGMDLVLAPHLHRRGLARPAYRIVLRDALAAGAQTFKGGTAQPGVLRIGAQTGRRAASWILRRTPTFPWSHWRPYAP